uniref:Vesicle transport v-SNARE N-terminal domain-containing protein n=1 Tax=Arcella intermedia TaxID=1963864 RepID=A0A6B2LFS7_9EUKA
MKVMNGAREKIQLIHTLAGTSRQKNIMEVKKLFNEARELIGLMNSAIVSSGTTERMEYKKLIEGYGQALENLKKELQVAEGKSRMDDRGRILNYNPENGEYEPTPLASRGESAQEMMRNTTQILHDVERTGSGTVQSGADVLVELEKQREILAQSRFTLQNLTANLVKARGIMNDIWTNMTLTGIVKGLIILVLLVSCFCVVYFRFIWVPEKIINVLPPSPPVVNKTSTI